MPTTTAPMNGEIGQRCLTPYLPVRRMHSPGQLGMLGIDSSSYELQNRTKQLRFNLEFHDVSFQAHTELTFPMDESKL